MLAVNRRSFLERLGLGLGATLLSPIAQTLWNEARGEVVERKIFGVWLVANGMHFDWNFTPPEFKGASEFTNAVMDGPTSYTWPVMFKALEPYRNRMLLIDGLFNRNKGTFDGGHSMKYGALSCMPPANNKDPAGDGTPGGITLDQFIAAGLSKNTPRKSILVGISSKPEPLYASVFATGRDKPEPHFQSPAALFNDVFGNFVGDASGVNAGAPRQRILFDTMRADITRLQKALAGPERQKLDTYLTAMEEFEKREKSLGTLSCAKPPAPALAVKPEPEDVLASLHGMTTLAVVCGVTNVFGVALGCGFSHDTFPSLRKLMQGTPVAALKDDKGNPLEKIDGSIGHQRRECQGPVMDLVYGWCSGMLAKTIDALSKVQAGGASLWDRTCMLYTSENGEEHHADHRRWPLAVLGNAGGALKTDGRFLRFPKFDAPGARALPDLYCSLATAVGVPTSTFGMGGNETVKGPIELLMA